MSHTAKRARSSTVIDAVNPSTIPELVNSIDPKTISDLLIAAAKAYPDVASHVQREVDRIAAFERAKFIDFDYLSKSAWKTLNVTYARMKGSHAFDMSGEAAASIEGCVKTIRTDCPKTASFQTKKSALETLRKIGKSICLSDGVVGHEIKKDYQWGGEFVPTMLRIAETLTYEEKERLRPWCDDKLVELKGMADGHCIFEDLGRVVALWNGDEDDQDEDEDGDDGSSDGNKDVEGETGDEEEVEVANAGSTAS